MKIGIDIMGGDFAPVETIKGTILAAQELEDDVQLILIGDKSIIEAQLKENNFRSDDFEIVHAPSVIEMGEHPAKAFQQKQDSSIAVGYKLLAARQIDGFCSVGNTGAMMVGALYTIKQIPGVIRPVISTPLPRMSGNDGLILDVGLNADCKPDVLYQYAILGDIYAKNVLGYENPRIALLNIGKEKEKGNLLTKATYDLMSENPDFNFIGNVEGSHVFDNDYVDVIVCDGFTGNVVLKQAEGFYSLLKKRNITDEYFERFNFENYGATAVLGVNGNVTIGHGKSNAAAFRTGILNTKIIAEVKLSEKIKEAFM